VLSDLLPGDCIYHLSLFVSAMHILLGDTISLEDIELAHNLLSAFYELATQLYPTDICTMNLHMVIHYSKVVRSWGPLWCYSCFGFESMNGHLRKNCHGTRLVLTQLIHNVRMRQLLPMKSKKIISSATPMVANFLESLADVTRNGECRTDLKVKGRITHKRVTETVANALLSANFIDNLHPLPVLPVCERIRHNSILYVATNGKDRVRDGSICIYKYESTLHFGSILQFCFVKRQLVAIVRVFQATEDGILNSIHTPTLPDNVLTLCSTVDNFVFASRNSP